MAVFTQITRLQVVKLLSEYEIGDLVRFSGIGEGSENTNYFVSTTQGDFVLTLFERIDVKQLPYYLDLMTFLAGRGIPCAAPMKKHDGECISRVAGKPAVIVPRLLGTSIEEPESRYCYEVGLKLAELHEIGSEFTDRHNNPFSLSWHRQSLQELSSIISGFEFKLLNDEINYQENLRPVDLPTGLIHADLFVDNVLFKDNKISGLIDFYYACQDTLLLDIAITMNDWCRPGGLALDPALKDAFLKGYQQLRKLTEPEKASLPDYLRLAALRFWVSRLLDFHYPRSGPSVRTKDPKEFQLILEQYL